MLNRGGLLIISSPYTWKPEHTEPSKWLGGYQADGENKFTVDGLRAHLAPELVLLEELKVPFVIPDADCLLYTSPSPRDGLLSRMPSSA